MRCDTIYVLKDGSIVEKGSHSELMNKHSTYFELWKEQIPTNTEVDEQ